MKKLFITVLALVMLVGCGGGEENPEKTTVCSGVTQGIEVVNTVKYENDTVNSITYQNVLEVDESLVEALKEAAQAIETSYAAVKGIKYEYKIEGTTFTESTTVNYAEADMSELVEVGMIEKGENGLPTYIDYELTIDNMASLGLTCTEQ